MRFVVALLLSAVLAACSHGHIETLPSGKQIKALGIGEMPNFLDQPALTFSYETEIPIHNRDALEKEADEVWEIFRSKVEERGLTRGVIMATPKQVAGAKSQGVGIIYKKMPDGSWSRK